MTSRRRDRSTQPLGSSLRAAEYLDAVVRVKEDGRRLANRLACEVNHPVVPLGERGPVAAARPTPSNQPFQQLAVGDEVKVG